MGEIEIGEGRVTPAIDPAKARFQVSLPRSHFVVVREANQDGDKPLFAIEDQHALLVKTCGYAHRLKGAGHAAA